MFDAAAVCAVNEAGRVPGRKQASLALEEPRSHPRLHPGALYWTKERLAELPSDKEATWKKILRGAFLSREYDHEAADHEKELNAISPVLSDIPERLKAEWDIAPARTMREIVEQHDARGS